MSNKTGYKRRALNEASTADPARLLACSALLALTILSTVSCSTLSGPIGAGDYPQPPEDKNRPASEAQRLVVEGGRTLVGKKSLVVNGVTYPNDCTGLVRAAYAFAPIDISYRFDRYTGNGVLRLYQTLHDQDLLYTVRYPAPADIIFWDNTYDANENGRADDELTHVGVVISVASDGSILYLHYHYRLGPVLDRMNLTRIDDESSDANGRINAILRMKGSPGTVGINAAQLFRVFAKGYELSTP